MATQSITHLFKMQILNDVSDDCFIFLNKQKFKIVVLICLQILNKACQRLMSDLPMTCYRIVGALIETYKILVTELLET